MSAMCGSHVLDAAAWRDANRVALSAAIDEMAARVDAASRGVPVASDAAAIEAVEHRASAAAVLDGTDSITVLADGFGLTPFECDLVILAAGAELDADLRRASAALAGSAPGTSAPVTFALASRLLSDPHWSSIGPARPLRGAGLVELGSGPLPDASITVAERVLHHLVGYGQLDVELARTATLLRPSGAIAPSHGALAEQVVAAWTDPVGPFVHITGQRLADCRDVAAAAAVTAGAIAYRIRAADLPTDPALRADLARRWRRELVLAATVLVVEADTSGPTSLTQDLAGFLDHLGGPVIVLGGAAVPALTSWRRVGVPVPERDEARALWNRHLASSAKSLRRHVDRAVDQFRLGAAEIAAVADDVRRANGTAARALWDGCRDRTRPTLDGLIERVVSESGWDDLVLPLSELDTLRAIVTHAEQRAAVAGAWGIPAGGRGSGITALFYGPSGTGKTLAGEVVANALGLDLYRIDLSMVVSKYIGETESNLRRVFDAADDGGVVLLFDEADALFGKRTEVRDSHDRYANIEVSYLLQRMETYRGLAILTTNLRSSLDASFLRRLQFVVAFPFPDEGQRAEIWRRVFPPGVATTGLDPERLAHLGVSGATIHGIARHAAHEAAADAVPVGVAHLQRAARRELAKLDRPISSSEMAGLQ